MFLSFSPRIYSLCSFQGTLVGSSGFEPQRSSQWSQRVAFRSFCSLAHWAAGSLLPALRALASAPSRLSGVLLPSLRLSLPPFFGRLVGSSGFEPPPSRLSGVRSNHLSYEPMLLSSVCLSYLSLFLSEVVEMNGIEPMTPCLQSRCSPS